MKKSIILITGLAYLFVTNCYAMKFRGTFKSDDTSFSSLRHLVLLKKNRKIKCFCTEKLGRCTALKDRHATPIRERGQNVRSSYSSVRTRRRHPLLNKKNYSDGDLKRSTFRFVKAKRESKK